MQRIYKIILVLFAVSLLSFGLAVGCSETETEEPNLPHTHTYAEEWSMNGGYHWHEPTCGDTDQAAGKEEHRYIGTEVCRVCGFDRSLYGTVAINDTAVLLGFADSKFSVQFSDPDKAETLEYLYDDSALTIDADEMTITASKIGSYTVEAVSAHYFARFTVTVSEPDFSNAALYDTEARFGGTIDSRAAEWADVTSDKTTVFIGDSFFDPWGWANFYADYAGADVKLLGISSTTSCHWEQILYEDRIFSDETASPANFVVNIGTNNYYDDAMSYTQALASIQRMFMILHMKFPDAHVYYYSITQRDNASYRTQVAETNSAMEAWCGLYDWITFIDTASETTSSDLRDGVHLTPEAYRSIFMPALEEAGCAIAMEEGAADTEIDDIVRTQADKVATSSLILYGGSALGRNFILSGMADITGTADNGHIEFRFESMGSRFLIWNNESNGIFKITAAYDTSNALIRTLTWDGELRFAWKLVVTDNDAYLYIDGDLAVILTEISGSGNLYVGSEGVDVSFTDMQALTPALNEDAYQAELAAMQDIIAAYAEKNTVQTIEFPPME